MLPRNNTDVTHCEKTEFYFQNKAVYRAEDRPTDTSLNITFTDKGKNLKFLISVFLWRHVKTKNNSWHMYIFTSNLCWCWVLSPSSLFSLIRSRCFLFSSLEYNSARYSKQRKIKHWSTKYGSTVKDVPSYKPSQKVLLFFPRGKGVSAIWLVLSAVPIFCALSQQHFQDPVFQVFHYTGSPSRQTIYIYQITARPLWKNIPLPRLTILLLKKLNTERLTVRLSDYDNEG